MELDPTRAAAVVADMQNGSYHPDGNLFASGNKSAIEPVTGLVAATRDAGTHVVYTRDVHPSEQFGGNYHYDELERWGEHVVGGAWDAALHDGLDMYDEGLVVERHAYDAFYRTQLADWSNSHGVDDLPVCGMLTNVCVLHITRSTGLRDYRSILIVGASGYIEEEHKAYVVDHTDWLFGETATFADATFEQTSGPVEHEWNLDSNPDPDASRDSDRVSFLKESIRALPGDDGIVPVARRRLSSDHVRVLFRVGANDGDSAHADRAVGADDLSDRDQVA